MRSFILGFATAAAVAAASAAGAVTLSFTGTGQTATVSGNDLGLGLNGKKIDMITGDKKSAANGLSVNGPAKVTYTFLGYEAGNTNFALQAGTKIFQRTSTLGSTITVDQLASGLIDFSFLTTDPKSNRGRIDNAGGASAKVSDYLKNIAIGYYRIDDDSYYVLFDDITSKPDRDFDDIGMRIDVAAIPLPAGGVLLLGGLGALAALRRRRAAA